MSESVEPIALSQENAARSLGISRRAIAAAIRDGQLTPRRNGVHVSIAVDELKQWFSTWPVAARRIRRENDGTVS